MPGVSALSAVPASAGIPVTHRGVSAQVTLVSGHSASGEDLDYAQLAGTPGTLVVFMGLAHLSGIAGGLIAAGKDPHTPAAVVVPRHARRRPLGQRRAPGDRARSRPRASTRRRCSSSATSSRWRRLEPIAAAPGDGVLAPQRPETGSYASAAVSKRGRVAAS